MDKKDKKELNKILNILYKLEDKTEYKNKNIGNAINWLQKELPTYRLEYLRREIILERISYEEIAELQSLSEYIDKDDVLLLEWAGIPEQI